MFTECDTCRAKSGCPALCSGCLANRKLIGELEAALAKHTAEPVTCEQKSIPLERHYKKAAKDIGDLFCWCVTHLTKFPPGPGVEWLDDVKRRLSDTHVAVQQPEVIEGRGQRVTEEQTGYWIGESLGGGFDMYWKDGSSFFAENYRYMRCPTFPPREKFQPPPKPELVLVKYADDLKWATRDGDWFRTTSGHAMSVGLCEVLDTATGNVIKE